METVINQTLNEINRDTKKKDFWQNRAAYFVKYVQALRGSGTQQQKHMITQIDTYREEARKHQDEKIEVEEKLRHLRQVVDRYTKVSNMLLEARYA